MSLKRKEVKHQVLVANDETIINKDVIKFRQPCKEILNFNDLIPLKYSKPFTLASEVKVNISASFDIFDSLIEHLLHHLLIDDKKRL